MHTKRHVLEQVLHLSRRNIFELLYLRVVLDVQESQHSLHQDMEDLTRFPERIDGSYRDEWRAFIKRQLYRRAFKAKGIAAKDNLQQFLTALINDEQERIQTEFTRYKAQLELASEIQANQSVEVFPSPLHHWLAMAIK